MDNAPFTSKCTSLTHGILALLYWRSAALDTSPWFHVNSGQRKDCELSEYYRALNAGGPFACEPNAIQDTFLKLSFASHSRTPHTLFHMNVHQANDCKHAIFPGVIVHKCTNPNYSTSFTTILFQLQSVSIIVFPHWYIWWRITSSHCDINVFSTCKRLLRKRIEGVERQT